MRIIQKTQAQPNQPEDRIVEEWQTLHYTPPTFEYYRPAKPKTKQRQPRASCSENNPDQIANAANHAHGCSE